MLGTYYIIVIYTKYSPIHVLVLYMYVWCGVIVNACELYRNFAGFAFGLLFSFFVVPQSDGSSKCCSTGTSETVWF